ncbi:MAG: YraN family protein [Chitinophagaceae bacterium]|nr:YraN family protein [Chitinophagaceae bacterium]
MAEHILFGRSAEEIAASWLEQKGFEILHRNWRYRQYEIDIIARKEKFLHFVEVKARNASPVGNPEDNVGKKKFRSLKRAADEYLFRNPGHPWIEYNILSITFYRDREPEFFFMEDVFL